MITSELIDRFMSINMETVDMGKLADIYTLEFDNSPPKNSGQLMFWKN